MSSHFIAILPDGAKLAYEILGQEFIGRKRPLVLVAGVCTRGIDFERLSDILARERPVLIYDHRGIGDSTWSSAEGDDVSIELLARDLLFLVSKTGWKEVAFLGYSMGGVVLQQLVLLPYHTTKPTRHPFKITHAILTSTSVYANRDPRLGLQFPAEPPTALNIEELKTLLRPAFAGLFDPDWVSANQERFEGLLENYTVKRPFKTVFKQKHAMSKYDLGNSHDRIPQSMSILVIHGKKDGVVPYDRSETLLKLLPSGRRPSIGNTPGSLPNYDFGHQWWEYFDIAVWRDVIESFLNDEDNSRWLEAKL